MHHSTSRFRDRFPEPFWTVDALLIGLVVFLTMLGAMDPRKSPVLTLLLLVLVAPWLLQVLSLGRGGSKRRGSPAS